LASIVRVDRFDRPTFDCPTFDCPTFDCPTFDCPAQPFRGPAGTSEELARIGRTYRPMYRPAALRRAPGRA
jgi:hypothetical protein